MAWQATSHNDCEVLRLRNARSASFIPLRMTSVWRARTSFSAVAGRSRRGRFSGGARRSSSRPALSSGARRPLSTSRQRSANKTRRVVMARRRSSPRALSSGARGWRNFRADVSASITRISSSPGAGLTQSSLRPPRLRQTFAVTQSPIVTARNFPRPRARDDLFWDQY